MAQPSGVAVSRTLYSPKYSSSVSAFPSSPVTTVATTSPELACTVPSGVATSAAAVTS